jgi:drug/metabolite transporter superfamily protein YnfA
MPVWLRVAYGGMTLLMLAIARLAYLYFVNDVTRRQRNLGRLVVLLFALSTAVNAISQSQPERYNAIGAGVTMIGIAILRRRPKSNFVDLRLRH